jgi:hypothetical protein
MKGILVFVMLLTILPQGGCTKAPPNLSPQATTAWYGTRVIRAMDLLRDTAVDAEKARPQLVSTQTMLQVVRWHRSTLQIVHLAPLGWQRVVMASLDGLEQQIQAEDKPHLVSYINLVRTVLQEIAVP